MDFLEPDLSAAPSNDPHVRLAHAVLAQALHDCTVKVDGKRVDVGLKDNADAISVRAFLSQPSDTLEFWCAVAGVSMARVIALYWKNVARYRWHGRVLAERKRLHRSVTECA